MCGIVGIFDTHGTRDIDRAALHRMNESQHHRGPDEGELYTEKALGMGHRRLSVIDLATGQQPLFNADRSVVIVYNGEIYNYRELMAELKGMGHVFQTKSDTEVVLQSWLAWGPDCVHRLKGMFAFGIWDRNQQTMFLARDHVGIKPMFYSLLPTGYFVFGSELKSIMTHPELSRELNVQAVEDFFAYGYVPDPKTIFHNAYKLQPGHRILLKVGDKAVRQEKWWDVSFQPQQTAQSEADIERELIDRLRASVQSQMVAEVPLGAFLSGGVDSSAVVAMMAQQDGPVVNTCSIGFNDPEFDETKYAQQVAQRYNTVHHAQIVDNDDYGLIDTLARLYDEPFADSSAIPTYRVCQLARQRVTVALSGDGGDENFAGYRRYRYAMAEQSVRDKLPAGLRKPLFGALGKWYPKADWAPRVFRAKTTFEALARDLVEGYFHGVSIMPDRVRAELFSDKFKASLQGYRAIDVMQEHAANTDAEDPLSVIQYLDFKTWLPGGILTKVDRASMAHSLEVRVPILDHTLVEWAAGLPAHLKLHGGEGKYIFKQALRPHLSEDILFRSKRGFSIPLASWFRGPLKQTVRDTVLSPLLLDTGLFNERYLRHMVEQHESGMKDYSAALWSVLMFATFLRVSAYQ
ncbi:amidotransferase 1, exosortase A system-associated [Pseudoduganella ginsengisoli]|uniref:asparagine synthase (glutamine-hydrolyzing) n=1 Tax=Pseudoduganella ginsengisoli TaxID=1462440 RepID=A0A6L6PZI4_9BURK|nr:XrtA/PEP-CTERM system amidotransferase [Pseudoduganella ginsengisoli]MTW02574.1 amidotransferase 1, exosortase A system-associated [Pseudoduganella ginsengisoli]